MLRQHPNKRHETDSTIVPVPVPVPVKVTISRIKSKNVCLFCVLFLVITIQLVSTHVWLQPPSIDKKDEISLDIRQERPRSFSTIIKDEIKEDIDRLYSFNGQAASEQLPASLFKAGNLPSTVTITAIDYLYSGKNLDEDFVAQVLDHSKKMLRSLPSVVDVDVPDGKVFSYSGNTAKKTSPHLTVVGDTHGQLYGVVNIFAENGFPTRNNPYVFSGDMIDSGNFSLKLMLSLLMIKLSCPDCIHLIRGNHETDPFVGGKTVKREIVNAYGQDAETILELFVETINELPISILLQGSNCRAMVIHGGIVGADMTIDDVNNIKRSRNPTRNSFFENLLWADPSDENGMTSSTKRGISFGPDITESFLKRNGLCLLIRGHSYKEEGYDKEHDDTVITLYSSPQPGHKGAVLQLNSELETMFVSFNSAPYPIFDDWLSVADFNII